MARKIKIDNAVLKRRARKEQKRKKGQRAIRKFILIVQIRKKYAGNVRVAKEIR